LKEFFSSIEARRTVIAIYTVEVYMAIYHVKDNCFKLVLGNHQLLVQFLQDFIPIDALKDIKPEDIEDVKERYIPLFQENRDSDTVKRINLKEHPPLFVIAIVEHESRVNFRTSFKMLQYICLVLDAWEKEQPKEAPFRKDFRYPPVLPIVFHDGPDTWTAEKNFLQRTALNDVFEKYIPKFEYELVDLKQYSPQAITEFNDCLSLILLIDRMGTIEGKNLLEKLPRDYFEQLRLKIPKNLTKLLSDVAATLMQRFGLPQDKITEISGYIEQKELTTMFDALVENYWKSKNEGIGIGEARGIGIGEARGIAIGEARGREEGMAISEAKAYQERLESIRSLKRQGVSPEIIASAFSITPEELANI
jgi:hypothetical protein